MSTTVISVEHLSKAYRLGQVSIRLRHSTRRIGTGTLTYDMKLWWAKMRGKCNRFVSTALMGGVFLPRILRIIRKVLERHEFHE
jgi:hypothetical protein